MRFIKELLLAALFTAVFFVVLMALLPSKASVERKLEINHPIVQVYDFVKTFKQFPAWSPWGKRDPQTTYEFTPALAGPGAQVDWFSANDPWVGEGSLQVLDESPGEWINYRLVTPWRGESKDMDLVIAENEMGAVIATLKVDVDYGWDLLGRVNGLYLEGHLGEDLNFALHQIKNKVESFPDVDYADDFGETPPILVESEPRNVIQIDGQAATNQPYSVQPTVMQFTNTLTATIDIQNLTQTGPRLAILNRWGQNYDFTAAVPVRETEGEVPENVSFATIEGGRFLKISHTGARWDLPRQRDMLVAWAGANGFVTRGNIIEEFLNDPGGEGDSAIRDADLQTNIYLPVR
jgi:effector-binding domain-containing protein/uncharacterized protein YndB with AHSA1/START domain